MKLAFFALSLGSAILLASPPDASLQKAIQRALYRIEPAGDGYSIENPGQRLTARFAAGKTEFTFRNHHFSLKLMGVGPVRRTRVRESRIEFDHDAVVEWFTNDPRGIEQGFTVARRRSAWPLRIVLEVGGDLWPESAGARVILRNCGGATLNYAGLESRDADGHLLPSFPVVDGRKIILEVDDRRARYPVTVDPWLQSQTLTGSDEVASDDFGSSVAASGATVVVGAPGKNSSTGAAYVFTHTGATWSMEAEITPSDGEAGDRFGSAVAVNGSTILVGAPGRNNATGTAYIFSGAGGAWGRQAELTAPDGVAGDGFGLSLAVSTSAAVVGVGSKSGNTGVAYVFALSGTTWSIQTELMASDGMSGDHFGNSVAMSGGTALVGAYGKNSNKGAAFLFTQSGANWNQQAEIAASDGISGDYFGSAVSLSDGSFVVGAPGKNGQGAGYVFMQSGASWNQQAELTAPGDGVYSNELGASVAVSGGIVLLGAPGYTEFKVGMIGATYLSTQSDSGWSQPANFGGCCAVAVSDGIAVVGSPPLVLDGGFIVASTGVAYVSQYENVNLLSNPSGRSFQLSGPGCGSTGTFSTPYAGFWTNCTVQWTSPDKYTPNALYTFQSWSDGDTENPRTFTPDPSATTTYSANFQTQYQLTTQTSPVAGGTATPAGAAFYDAGTVVPITANVNNGYSFGGWAGSVASASSASTTVTMNAPQTVTANFTYTGYQPFFSGEVFLGGSVYYLQFPDTILFGYYSYLSSSILYHQDLGYEAFILSTNGSIYFYDFLSGHWWYTAASLFPNLYDFTLGAWIYYFSDPANPGHYTANPRKFAYDTTHAIFTM